MMDVEFGKLVVFMGAPAVGVLVWLIRLEGRVNTNQALQERMAADVNYIRERIDRGIVIESQHEPRH